MHLYLLIVFDSMSLTTCPCLSDPCLLADVKLIQSVSVSDLQCIELMLSLFEAFQGISA